ncbi:hypothetical protein KKI24_26815 [bacterium]|nr:hypothetical protein [bacterium]
MLKKLSQLWKGDAPLKKEYQQFVTMLNLAREMYHKIIDALNQGEQIKELAAEIYQKDLEINKLERKIRKALVTHLSVNPGEAVAGSLVLMSIVKDAERLGDFCKNLYEATEYWCRSCSELFYADRIKEFEKNVSEVFDLTIKAFETEDSVLAAEIIQDEARWDKRFDGFIGELVNSEVTTREAVCTVLMIRTLKRLHAHLSNIASSVVLPLHRLDSRPEELDES